MANSKRKCKGCGEYFAADEIVKVPAGVFCSKSHAIEWALKESEKAKAKSKSKAAKDTKEEIKRDRKRLKARKLELNRTSHLDKLQKLVNQYVVHVRDKDKPCCTCGTTSQAIKYDCGHMRSRGSCPELRFELTNMAKQCSQQCNVHKSGNRIEFERFIVSEYGEEHLTWLNGPHPKLKEQLPDADAIESEIKRYRKLLRDSGFKPNV